MRLIIIRIRVRLVLRVRFLRWVLGLVTVRRVSALRLRLFVLLMFECCRVVGCGYDMLMCDVVICCLMRRVFYALRVELAGVVDCWRPTLVVVPVVGRAREVVRL